MTGQVMTDADLEQARNRRLARNIESGADVCSLDQVIKYAIDMGDLYLDVPGPRAAQLAEEVLRLRKILNET